VTTIEAPPGHPGTLRHAGGAALLGAALTALAVWGSVPLLVGVALVQLVLVLGFLALVDAPAAVGVFTLGTAAALASDVVVEVEDGKVGGLAGVLALSLVGGLLLQLVRKHRTRVTESLADTLVVTVLVASLAALPAAVHDGTWVVRAGLVAATAALVVSRLAERLRAGTAALVTALVVGVVVAPLVAGDHLGTRDAVLLGLAVAAAAAAADQIATWRTP
jgi:hypothetical protein